ncbi:GNAT family N-acetyltransferase [Kineococcus rhizosphaerae]|uniref:GNAT family N-acetyltransferase n=1 Tax=Kineococcus rhizosphaerae TaxID=559628 RepID=UPI0011B23A35|nr:GNAT family N-acetyltransferase [Kineococcus rhizosphaerae]
MDRAEAVQAAAEALAWYRPGRRTTLDEAARSLERAHQEQEHTRGDFGPHGVGAEPGRWGTLSGAKAFYLEETLRQVLRAEGQRALSVDVAQLLEEMPGVRLNAHRGDRSGEAQVRQAVRVLAGEVKDTGLRRRVVEHLPVEDRPRVHSVRDLHRGHSPITFFVSDDLQETRRWIPGLRKFDECIELHDIVVHDGLGGRGLGTAALQELCRYADDTNMQVVARLNPGPGYDDYDDRVQRLARWYARHGFVVDSLPAEQWPAESVMVREPASAH